MNQENKVWFLWWLPKLVPFDFIVLYLILLLLLTQRRGGNKIKCLLSIFLFWPLFVSFQDSYWNNFITERREVLKSCGASFPTHHPVLYCFTWQRLMVTWPVQSCPCPRKEEDGGVSEVQKSPLRSFGVIKNHYFTECLKLV